MGCIQLVLPYPPTINHYYRPAGGKSGGRLALTAAAKRFRHDVGQVILINHKEIRAASVRLPYCGPVAVAIELHPLDNRVRDIDNTIKPLLDALQHNGVIDNDKLVEALSIRKVKPDGQMGFAGVTIFDAQDAGGLWAL